MLHPLLGTPLIVHTLRRAREAGCFDEILCLTDAPAVLAAAEDPGFTAVLSGPAMNGTDRIAKPAPQPEPDDALPASGNGQFKIGDTDVRISGSITIDMATGGIRPPNH